MLAGSHVTLGAACGLGCAWVAGVHGIDAAGIAGIAGFVAPLPDVDQRGWWRAMDRWLPDEWLGRGGPLQHRGLTHWVGLPVAAGVTLWPATSGPARLALIGVLAGWLSHLLGDWIFGKRGYGRGPGIPLAPWWAWTGLGLDCGGLLETLIARPLLLLGLLPAAWVVIFGGTL